MKRIKFKMNIHHPKTIDEAISDLHQFFEVDMWYAKGAEWKTEQDMWDYLQAHFDVLKKEIKRINKTEVQK